MPFYFENKNCSDCFLKCLSGSVQSLDSVAGRLFQNARLLGSEQKQPFEDTSIFEYPAPDYQYYEYPDYDGFECVE